MVFEAIYNFLINTRPEQLMFAFGSGAGCAFFVYAMSEYLIPGFVKDMKDIFSKQPLREEWKKVKAYLRLK